MNIFHFQLNIFHFLSASLFLHTCLQVIHHLSLSIKHFPPSLSIQHLSFSSLPQFTWTVHTSLDVIHHLSLSIQHIPLSLSLASEHISLSIEHIAFPTSHEVIKSHEAFMPLYSLCGGKVVHPPHYLEAFAQFFRTPTFK